MVKPILLFFSLQNLSWFLLVVLVFLVAWLLWLYWRKTDNPRKIKILLNGMLLLWLAAYLWDPTWEVSEQPQKLLLLGNELSQSQGDSLRSHYRLPAFTQAKYNNKNDSLILMGRDFDPAMLYASSPVHTRWIPIPQEDSLDFITWKSVLAPDEKQVLDLKLNVGQESWLYLTWEDENLDRVSLSVGYQEVRFEFAPKAKGRNRFEVKREGNTLADIRFYVQPSQPFSIQFLLPYPDFESRQLATWLVQQGLKVQFESQVSENVGIRTDINQPDNPTLLITNPTFANSNLVKALLEQGHSVFFYGFQNPNQAIQSINTALDLQWELSVVDDESSSGESVSTGPFRLKDKPYQWSIHGDKVAFQRSGSGKVGLSLYQETFPWKIEGDSLRYDAFWSEVLIQLRKPPSHQVALQAPVFPKTKIELEIYSDSLAAEALSIGNDTVYFSPDWLNPHKQASTWIPDQSGWVKVAEEMEIYVEESEAYASHQQSSILAHTLQEISIHQTAETKTLTRRLPDAFWWISFLVVLSLLWLEPKIRP
ncbi:hypothetical protein [Pararhodonellum marinum]|uniref:hypothetical protein n=1 Tax=Pararhodonellum marinum TaxID=2755358 RepID=UPI00188FB6FF|nr:hypothetical protein [Pararhodonellum marinum]